MELILKNSLPHQDKGVLAVSNVFKEVSFDKNSMYYANPTLDLDKEKREIVLNMYKISSTLIEKLKNTKYKVNIKNKR
jgi:hypothetical protein